MKKYFLVGSIVTMMAGGAAVILLPDGKAEMGEMRIAKIDGLCPEDVAKCDGWMEQRSGHCLCATKIVADDMDDEVAADDVADIDTWLMLVCNKSEVRTIPYTERLPEGCQTVAKFPFDTNGIPHSVPSEIERILSEACAPCVVSPGNWGACPRCILAEGGCQKACADQTVEAAESL